MNILNAYLEDLSKLHKEKQQREDNYAKKIIFSPVHTGRKFSLSDVNTYKAKIQPRLNQNEISSVTKVMDSKVVIFNTATISPILNIPDDVQTFKEIDSVIKCQYQQFKKFHRAKMQFKFNNSKLSHKFIRVYELTSKLNLHSHCVDMLNSKKDIEHYLKALIHRRKNHSIGRVELAIELTTFNFIKKLFDEGFTIRVKNKYIKLNIVKKFGHYIISDFSNDGKGNFIYFKILKKIDNMKSINKYVFRYLLKTKNPTSKERLVFSKLKIRAQQFSKNFFDCNVRKDILYRTSHKLYAMVKRNHKEIFLNPNKEQMNRFIFYTSKLFNKDNLVQYGSLVLYKKNNKSNTLLKEILNTQKYQTELYKYRQNSSDKNHFDEDVFESEYAKYMNQKIYLRYLENPNVEFEVMEDF